MSSTGTTTADSGAVEACEGGCGAKVFTSQQAGRRPELREVAKCGSVEHTAGRCRELRAKVAAKAAEKAEAKNVAASHRSGHQQRHAVGEHFYTHPAVPNRAFDTPRRSSPCCASREGRLVSTFRAVLVVSVGVALGLAAEWACVLYPALAG